MWLGHAALRELQFLIILWILAENPFTEPAQHFMKMTTIFFYSFVVAAIGGGGGGGGSSAVVATFVYAY